MNEFNNCVEYEEKEFYYRSLLEEIDYLLNEIIKLENKNIYSYSKEGLGVLTSLHNLLNLRCIQFNKECEEHINNENK